MVERPWVPRDAYNSTGDRLLTDGEAAVVRINSCDDPKTTPATPAPPPNRTQRATRDTALTIRSDLYRGNVVYMGITGVLQGKTICIARASCPRTRARGEKQMLPVRTIEDMEVILDCSEGSRANFRSPRVPRI
jgi:hypothetical protein